VLVTTDERIGLHLLMQRIWLWRNQDSTATISYVFSYDRDVKPLRQQRNKILVNMVAPTNYTSDTPTQKLH
jgi:hypothetical protein